jgi:NTE family protein
MSLADLIRARTGTKAQWLCAQNFPDDKILYNVLLASAAIPLAFPQREINGQFYVDGALGDNIPLGALAARGCTHAIVIHLGNGETWNRHDFPEQTVIEIRPEQRINKFDTPIVGSVSSLLDFSAERIAELKSRGYEDAKRCLEPIIETFRGVQSQRQSHYSLIDSTQRLLNDPPL